LARGRVPTGEADALPANIRTLSLMGSGFISAVTSWLRWALEVTAPLAMVAG
jgi:hypothetical protein